MTDVYDIALRCITHTHSKRKNISVYRTLSRRGDIRSDESELICVRAYRRVIRYFIQSLQTKHVAVVALPRMRFGVGGDSIRCSFVYLRLHALHLLATDPTRMIQLDDAHLTCCFYLPFPLVRVRALQFHAHSLFYHYFRLILHPVISSCVACIPYNTFY